MSNAGGSQKKRKVAVPKFSAETQACESCQQHDMEVDRDEGMEELGFIPERGERFRWVARTLQGSSTCATKSATKRASSSLTSQTFWWKTTERRTRSPLVGRKKRIGGNEFRMEGHDGSKQCSRQAVGRLGSRWVR